MNFLAHFHLSGDNEAIMVGNFLGDFVRGSQADILHGDFRKGLLLHKFIDEFTDSHAVVKACNGLLQPYFGKYASVVTDVYFDYFLAKEWSLFCTVSLREYTDRVYGVVGRHQHLFTPRAKRFYNYMIRNDILFRYATKEGMEMVFTGLSFRARNISRMETAVDVLNEHEHEVLVFFGEFYPQLAAAVREFMSE